jgi:hypothetical protein
MARSLGWHDVGLDAANCSLVAVNTASDTGKRLVGTSIALARHAESASSVSHVGTAAVPHRGNR